MKKRQIIITSMGNALEWFDFGLLIFLAPVIGNNFFPSNNPTTSTLAALSVFAAGFICRPLGGILFGHSGDTIGRAKTLRISVLLITVSTLLIGLLPGFQTIGIFAPITFTLLRLAQGLSVGGEYSGVMIYLAESAPSQKRGLITSFAAIGANLGFLIATLAILILNTVFSDKQITDWAWRLLFILAGLPGSIILYYRFKLTETPVFSNLKKTHHLIKQPFLTALRDAPKQLLKIFGLTCMSSSLYYVFFGYMPTYLHLYQGINEKTALFMQSISLMAMLFLVPLAGYYSDKFGRKKILIFTSVSTIILSIPCFLLLQSHSLLIILFSLSIATILSSLDQGTNLSAVVENCPANIRYSGIAFSYNLGNALFGGTAPLLLTLLSVHVNKIAPAYYLMVMAGMTLIAATTLLGKKDINKYFT